MDDQLTTADESGQKDEFIQPGNSNDSESTLNKLLKNKKILLIAIVILIIIAICGSIYFLNSHIQDNSENELSSSTQVPTSIQINNSSTADQKITPTPNLASEVIRVDEKTNKYINHVYGFAIPYSKYNLGRLNCSDYKNSNFTNLVPLDIFEDISSQRIYIAELQYMEANEKTSKDGSINIDYSTCKEVQTTLDSIIDNKNVSLAKSGPEYLWFAYKKINTDEDLQTLVNSTYPGCLIGNKTPTKENSAVFNVSLVDKSGSGNNVDSENDCILNFSYKFLYSPKNQVAVITSGLQDSLSWSNGMKEPLIEFLSN